MYKNHEVYISLKQKKRLQSMIKRKKKTSIRLSVQPVESGGEKAILLLTNKQKEKVEDGQRRKRNVSFTMSKRQVSANVKYEGGFLSILARLAARYLPTLLTGLASGAISGAVEKAITSKGNGLYLQKGGHCYRADPVEGNGLYLSPHQPGLSAKGDGMFLKKGNRVYDGKGFILGANSPFKDIPILGWIL